MSTRAALTIGLLLQLPTASLLCTGCDDAAANSGDAGPAAGGGGSGDKGSSGQGGAGAAGKSAGGAGGTHTGGTGGAGGASGRGGAGGQGGANAQAPAENIQRSAVEADAKPNVDDAAYTKLVTQLNQFGLELGRRQADANGLTTKNSIYSPLSAAVALSMTYAGARGDTEKEMGSVLSGDITSDNYHSGINRLSRELTSRNLQDTGMSDPPKRIELNIADALYVDESLHVEEPFLDQLARNYDSGVHLEDFAQSFEPARMHMNDWVASKTHDRIKDLFPQGSITADTRFVLVNALYFYGSWQSPFKASSTSDADFHTLDNKTVSVPTMHAEEGMPYAAGSGFVAVDLPYVGGHLSMLVVLPDDGQFETVRKAVSGTWLDTTLKSLSNKNVRLSLPKFKLTSDTFKLTQPLIDMGMKTSFSDAADFSGITQDASLKISDVLQKAFVAVDEAGTEAAAATGVVGVLTSAAQEVTPFVVDRPFLFVIHDDSGAVLFTGHIVNPALEQ